MKSDRRQRVSPLEGLTRFLLRTGAMKREWAGAFEAVPREVFLPDLMWPYDMDSGRSRTVDRRTDLVAWERAAYANVPVTTQWDDGQHPGPGPGQVPTSSASMPSVVTRMLGDLDVYPGARVLEIGTGTGWNAGLLSARLGDRNVVSVEVDERVASRARAKLGSLGLFPEVVCADGRDGWAARAPYDRVIVTAGVREFPSAWVRQTRPGGLIVAPWGTHYCDEDALVRLTVVGDGTASGPFLRPLEFMKLRAQRLDWGRFGRHVREYPGDADESATSVTLSELGEGQRFRGARFVLGLCVPDSAHVLNAGEDGESTLWFFDMTEGSRSWASVLFQDGKDKATVYQSGPRRLWDEVAAALEWWRGQGAPQLNSFGLTISRDGTSRPWIGDSTRPLPTFGAGFRD
ncbi:methyltransferase domain-containing protein [Streptomyces sp. G-5]|uniref:methyltransferase domain-containing protein n=1 Tax=Streptomyces TaxID=1883 RepID=UPI0021D238F9|nr:methyltransferase domain-containing protein [Streptomyces sp. G-5]MCU4747160.1 methyltransferase domain-containing protein [Streptomyces sp. G-5]